MKTQQSATLMRRSLDGVLRLLSHVAAGATARRFVVLLVLFCLLSSAAVVPVGAVSDTSSSATVASQSADGEWTHYESVVIFRNDDIQPYYRQPEMRAVDKVFVEEDVPVTQGVIPMVRDRPINPNGELCQYIRTQSSTHPDTFEYTLHGYTHNATTTFYGGSEFGEVAYETQYRRISEGTDALESCTGERPTTFIPPFDTYDNNTVRALTEQQYTAISGGGWFTIQHYNTSKPFQTGDVLHVPNSKSFVSDWSNDEIYTERELEQSFDAAYENNDLYMQMLHYPTFTDEKRLQTLRGLIQHMKSKDGVYFTTVGEFAAQSRNGELKRVDDGWLVRESTGPETSTPTETGRTEQTPSAETPTAKSDTSATDVDTADLRDSSVSGEETTQRSNVQRVIDAALNLVRAVLGLLG